MSIKSYKFYETNPPSALPKILRLSSAETNISGYLGLSETNL